MRTLAGSVCLALWLTGCGADRTPVACAAYAAAGLGVTVTNAMTGAPICDAVVTASEGSYSEQLFASSCAFSGAYERPGTYVVRATRQGFHPGEVAAVHVVMGGGECPHVEQARVTVPLAPEG